MDELMDKLMGKLHLGHLMEEPVAIRGGLLHKMYRVSTSHGRYAVKRLNPEIMKRADALSNMIYSERIARAFEGLLPAVSALETEGEQVQKLDGEYYLVFPWAEGNPVFPGEIRPCHCEAIGGILGRIHHAKLKVEGVAPKPDPFEMFDWGAYLRQIDALECSVKECGPKEFADKEADDGKWMEAYKDSLQDLEKWNRMACDSEKYLSKQAVISHRDLDPKNVIWNDGKPYVIDWEAAGYVNPWQELLEVINYWADDGAGRLDRENCNALVRAYCSYMDISAVSWVSVIQGSRYNMLGWLGYNLKRALGEEGADEAEILLGREQVAGTIRELYSYQEKMSRLLPALQIERGIFKNLDL